LFNPKDKKSKQLLDYFENKTWLIIESSASVRSSLKKTISQLGSKMANMSDADNFSSAEAAIISKKPNYIIANKNIPGGSSIALYASHLKIAPNRINSGFFIIADISNVSEVAFALDYDMDGIISTPFTGDAILDALINSVKYKAVPTAYAKKIEDGRTRYLKGELEAAKEIFGTAIILHKHPYEGHYFIGKINADLGLQTEAIENLKEALLHNPAFYKALNTLSSIYYEKKDYLNAYNINLKMAENYPTAPERIPFLIRLSIINQKYEDLINYNIIFRTIKSPTLEMQNYISAGLAVLGKYFLSINDTENGLIVLKDAFKFCNGKHAILRSIADSFSKFNKLDVFFGLFDKLDISGWSLEAQGLYFYALQANSNDDRIVVTTGEKLLKGKVKEFFVYSGLFLRGLKMQRKRPYFENLVQEGLTNIPEFKNELEALMKQAPLSE
jgi:tetratricopeptide (TPR) repeat protein